MQWLKDTINRWALQLKADWEKDHKTILFITTFVVMMEYGLGFHLAMGVAGAILFFSIVTN